MPLDGLLPGAGRGNQHGVDFRQQRFQPVTPAGGFYEVQRDPNQGRGGKTP